MLMLRNKTNGDAVAYGDRFGYVESLHGWVKDGAELIPDTGQNLEVAARPPLVTPTEMKMLFPAEARIAIRSSANSDPIISDWLILLNDMTIDPRRPMVDLSLSPVQKFLDYLIEKGIITVDDKSRILAGAIV